MSNICDHSCKFFAAMVIEKLRQSHCSVEPGGNNFHAFGLVSGDQMIHCWYVAAWCDCPDFIMIGERLPALGQTWFVAIVLIE